MDPFSDILTLVSARSYATAGLAASNHWAQQFVGFDGLKFIFIQSGHFWFRFDDEQQWLSLSAGEGVIITRHRAFVMATDKALKVRLADEAPKTVSDPQASDAEPNLLLAGKMELDATGADLLLSILPGLLTFDSRAKPSHKISWLMQQLYSEKRQLGAGYTLACDHLMHLAIIEVFRDWLQRQTSASGIAAALIDPRILKVLHHLHQQPAKAWQLHELAAIASLSRAAFAKHFHEVMGITPIRYLTAWRMRLASKALRFSGEAIKTLAFDLGYKNESTFSVVFKRHYGHSPSQHRRLGQGVTHSGASKDKS